jgi:SMI1/KNR4 family protein SUKH-1
MTTSIPDGFGPEFLDWFRAQTEAYWANIPEATPQETLAQYVGRRVGGCSWQHGTKRLDGLSDEQIDAVEARWNIRFPPDYRLFLRRLHTVDKPMRCARYIGHEEATASGNGYLATVFVHESKQHMALGEGPSFYDWIHGADSIRDALENVVDGLIFDVENNHLWPESWGTKPDTVEERELRVRELVAAAPKLIPVFEHRFLLAEPCEAGNPIFSIMQSDIIVYGANLHDYFLIEFVEELLALSPNDEAVKTAKARISDILRYESIPFWGELLFA